MSFDHCKSCRDPRACAADAVSDVRQLHAIADRVAAEGRGKGELVEGRSLILAASIRKCAIDRELLASLLASKPNPIDAGHCPCCGFALVGGACHALCKSGQCRRAAMCPTKQEEPK